MRLLFVLLLVASAAYLLGGAVDYEQGRAGMLPEPVAERSSDASGGRARLVGTGSESIQPLYQGRPIRWWAYRAVRNRREANQQRRNSMARARTIRRLQTVVRGKLAYPTGHWLDGAFLCLYRFERHPNQGWQTATGNGYHGGLQMDADFQRTYGPEWARRAFGEPAHLWPASVQISAAIQAWTTRGFGPWPNTRRMCGL